MDVNAYVLEMLVRERLEEARAEGARRALRSRRPRPAFRARLGGALIALGQRLAATPAPRPSASHG